MRYINSSNSIPIFYSTLPTQQLNDPPICGREVLNVLAEISRFPRKPPHQVVNECISGRFLENQYRMHPQISSFPARKFYRNYLKDSRIISEFKNFQMLRCFLWHRSHNQNKFDLEHL